MSVRLTGLMSGMDTESMITELVKARSTKVDKATKDQTKLEWKQDAWKDLNKKIKSLFSTVSDMRWESDYQSKTTSVSRSSVATVVTGSSAINTTQTLEVDKLAKTGYMTGGKLSAKDGEKVTSGTLVSSLGDDLVGKKISVTTGGKTKEIKITEDMTVGTLTKELGNAGITVNFDSSTQRMFLASKESGKDADFTIGGDADLTKALGLSTEGGASKIDGQDAEIILNNVRYTSKDNVFDINGLTITANEETNGSAVTLTTKNDTSGIYDKIKKFITQYSELINEMDKLYNAESNKLDPLTDEEKEAMTESEIEKWEEKIKSSLLRRDESLNSVSEGLKSAMLMSFEVNGKKMSLADFGIETLSYFSSSDNEKNAYHINGDEDDEAVSSSENKLRAMIASDPSAVSSFFAQLGKNLYEKMDKMSSSVANTRSYGSFYDDQKLKTDYKDYETKIKELQDKLNAYEDKWYKKFSNMEKAMAKMQSNTSAVTSMLGSSY